MRSFELAAVEHALLGERLQHMAAEAADRAFLDRHQHFVVARRAACQQLAVERLGETRIGDARRNRRAPRVPRRPSAPRRAACRARGSPPDRPRGASVPCRWRAARPPSGMLDADPVAARIAQRDRALRHGPPRSPPYARVRPRPPPPSPRNSAGRTDRRCRTSRHGSRRRRRRGRRGRWRSAPAGSGSPRHAPPDRRRAAGRSNRSRRTA